MKTIALLVLLSISNLFAQHNNTVLELSLSNQQSSEVKIYLAIYDCEQCFGIPEKAYFTRILIANNPFRTRLELKSGNYAIAVYQDINNNGKLDKNWMGIPTEPYGFSKDPVIRFGPPLYKDCMLKLQGKNNLCITLR